MRILKGFSKYLLVGGASYIFVTGLTLVLHEIFGVNEKLSFGASLGAVLIINVFLLKFFVFRSSESTLGSAFKFGVTSVSIRMVEFALFSVFLEIGLHYLVSSTFAMALGALSKFFILKIFVYKV